MTIFSLVWICLCLYDFCPSSTATTINLHGSSIYHEQYSLTEVLQIHVIQNNSTCLQSTPLVFPDLHLHKTLASLSFFVLLHTLLFILFILLDHFHHKPSLPLIKLEGIHPPHHLLHKLRNLFHFL